MFLGVHIPDNLKSSVHTDGVTVQQSTQEAEIEALPLKPFGTSTDAQSRASCWAVLPPSTAFAPSATAGLSRGWCGQPYASLGEHCLPSQKGQEDHQGP